MEKSKVPYEHFFFDWRGGNIRKDQAFKGPRQNFYGHESFKPVLDELQNFETIDNSPLTEPYFQGSEPVHLYIEEIERIWEKIDKEDDWSAFEQKQNDFKNLKKILG